MKFSQVVLLFLSVLVATEGVQHGTLRIGQTNPDNYYCDTITFPTTFTGVDPVKVFTSVGFGTSSSRVHDVVFTWVESVTTSSFKVCLVENGAGSSGNVTINWMAYQGVQSGVTDGSVRFNDWTTGTECKQVRLSQSFPSVPHVFVTAHHNVLDNKHDAATVWVEGITTNDFIVCMREARTFDGRHKDIDVTWMAMNEVPQTWNYHDFIRVDFPNTLVPSEADNNAFCQVVSFSEPYYAPPTIVVAPSHHYDSSNANAIRPEDNSIAAWVEETTRTQFKTCVKDLVGLKNKHHPIEVDYMVFGDLDPCINKTCEYFGVCQAMSASVAQCVCVTQCPSYQDLVCASNGRTFDNMCALEREICQTQGNYSYYHPGSCQGFPFDKGTHHLSHVSAESHCEVVSLQPYAFYPDKPIHVQLTVNYINASLPANVHDATVTWSEKVNPENFTVCMTKTGRNDQPTNDVASVDWIAYQGSPNGAVTGKERTAQWWTGTKCTTLSLPSGKFTGTPTVLVTLEHQRDGLKHDAASVWVEDISSSSFQVCIRELQNFDGIHEEIDLVWMAFETLHLPLFSEHGSVFFANTHTPLQSNKYAFCQDVKMKRNYTNRPSVLITATHNTSVGNVNPKCNGISAWIEDITSNTFRVCLKELYSDRYDPVTLQYVVVSEMCGKNWSYFNGFCYKTISSCASWNAAQSNCLDVNSNLTSVTSQEENTYIQHRHGGDTGWIGLQDIDSEGNFTWIDGSPFNFAYWARNQPNGYPGDQDCVHTLGLRHDYHWNDVTCGSCHAYTCKRDIDECSIETICHVDAKCTNTFGSHTCQCNSGYLGDGKTCSDINECSTVAHTCDANAQCTNTPGSYTCNCHLGFRGDGRNCSDIDECSSGSHSCHAYAQCTNAVGTYNCQCNPGYHGDGWACTDIDECTTGSHSCDSNAQCSNNVGSHTCQCNHGFHGDGLTCSDVDECSTGAHTCNVNAQCTNTAGSYNCQCNQGFNGDGRTCTDTDECSTGVHSCHANAQCTNTVGSYTCRCNSGYQGDGYSCSARTSFECWRMSTIPSAIRDHVWVYGGQTDRIRIVVDRDVLLVGYRLWGVYSGNGTHNVTITVEDSQRRGTYSGSYTTSSTQHTFVVRFSTPVKLFRGVTYTLSALLSGPYTYGGSGGYSSTVCNGMTVTFYSFSGVNNGSDQSSGQIPALIFA